MSTPREASVVAGARAGSTVVGFAAVAHLAAGGSLEPADLVATTGLAALLGWLLARRRSLTFPRVTLVALVAQPVLHAFLGRHGHDRPHDAVATGGHGHHASHATDAGAGTDVRMVVAHVVVSLVAGVTVRWGARWLRMMPGLARDVLVAARGPVLPVEMGCRPLPPTARVRLLPPAVLVSWDTRGPPR